MTDGRPVESLVSGACGLIPADLERDGAVDNEDAGYYAARDAERVWREVVEPHRERERQREADEAEGKPRARSRFV